MPDFAVKFTKQHWRPQPAGLTCPMIRTLWCDRILGGVGWLLVVIWSMENFFSSLFSRFFSNDFERFPPTIPPDDFRTIFSNALFPQWFFFVRKSFENRCMQIQTKKNRCRKNHVKIVAGIVRKIVRGIVRKSFDPKWEQKKVAKIKKTWKSQPGCHETASEFGIWSGKSEIFLGNHTPMIWFKFWGDRAQLNFKSVKKRRRKNAELEMPSAWVQKTKSEKRSRQIVRKSLHTHGRQVWP